MKIANRHTEFDAGRGSPLSGGLAPIPVGAHIERHCGFRALRGAVKHQHGVRSRARRRSWQNPKERLVLEHCTGGVERLKIARDSGELVVEYWRAQSLGR